MEIWGWKTIALFDVWSFEHFVSGIVVGAMVIHFLTSRSGRSKLYGAVVILCIAYMWEFLEYHLEIGGSGIEAVTYWFQGVEYWANRFITDPLLVLGGYFTAFHFEKTIKPARFTSITWVGTHVFIFPHCMYLHAIFA